MPDIINQVQLPNNTLYDINDKRFKFINLKQDLDSLGESSTIDFLESQTIQATNQNFTAVDNIITTYFIDISSPETIVICYARNDSYGKRIENKPISKFFPNRWQEQFLLTSKVIRWSSSNDYIIKQTYEYRIDHFWVRYITKVNSTKITVSPWRSANFKIIQTTCDTSASEPNKILVLNSDFDNWPIESGSLILNTATVATNTANNPKFTIQTSDGRVVLVSEKPVRVNTGIITTSNQAYAGVKDCPTLYYYNGTDFLWISPSIDNNTDYSSRAAAEGGTATSLVTTGEKYNWNQSIPTNITPDDDNKIINLNDYILSDADKSSEKIRYYYCTSAVSGSDYDVQNAPADAGKGNFFLTVKSLRFLTGSKYQYKTKQIYENTEGKIWTRIFTQSGTGDLTYTNWKQAHEDIHLAGTPTAPTASKDTNNNQVATTAFVMNALNATAITSSTSQVQIYCDISSGGINSQDWGIQGETTLSLKYWTLANNSNGEYSAFYLIPKQTFIFSEKKVGSANPDVQNGRYLRLFIPFANGAKESLKAVVRPLLCYLGVEGSSEIDFKYDESSSNNNAAFSSNNRVPDAAKNMPEYPGGSRNRRYSFDFSSGYFNKEKTKTIDGKIYNTIAYEVTIEGIFLGNVISPEGSSAPASLNNVLQWSSPLSIQPEKIVTYTDEKTEQEWNNQ